MRYFVILLMLFCAAHARPHGHARPVPRDPVRSIPAKIPAHNTPVKPQTPIVHPHAPNPPVQKSSWMPAFLVGLLAGHKIDPHYEANKKETKDEDTKQEKKS